MSDVFISYSRKDVAFAHILVDALKARNLETWIDWEDIPPSADWLSEIYHAIEAADTFVYIVSHNSKNSEVCSKEVQHAIDNHKRLVPIVIHPEIKSEELLPDIAALNWIFFPARENVSPQESDFQQPFDKLLTAIQTDLAWVKVHTRLQVRALEWENKQGDSSILLRGRELRDAETWLAQATGQKEPQPTTLQKQYLLAGRRDADRRQRITLGAVTIGFVIAVALAIVALVQSNLAQANALAESYARSTAVAESFTRATAEANAINQRATAEAASTLAVEQRNEAQRQAKIALSGQLSTQSQTQLTHHLDLAMLLAAESYLAADTYHARSSLLLALEQSPQLARIDRYPEQITALAFSPDGKWIAVAGCAQRDEKHDACLQNKIVFYDFASGQMGRVLAAGGGRPTGLAFTPDGSALFAAIAGDRIYRFDLSAGGQPAPIPLPAFANSSGMVAISPDGKYMASGGCHGFSMPGGLCDTGGIVLWDLSIANPPGVALKGVGTQMHNLAFSPQSDRLYAGDCAGLRTQGTGKSKMDFCQKGEVKTWNLPDGSMQAHPIEGTTSAIVSVDVSADGELLAAGEAAGIVHIINVANWKQAASYTQKSEIDSLLFSRSGSDQILASLSFGSPLAIHSATNSRDAFTLEPYQTTRFVNALAISPDGRFLASSSCAVAGLYMDCKESQIYLWNLFSWQPVAKVFNNSDPSPWSYWQVGFDPAAPQEPIVVAASTKDIVVWDVEKNKPAGQPFMTAPDVDISRIFLSHSGKVLVYTELIGNVQSTRMHFLDVATRQSIGAPVMIDGWALNLKFSPDDRWMVSDGPHGTFLVWDPAIGQVVHQISMTLDPGFITLAFSPDGKTLAAAGCIKGVQSCQTYRIEMYDMETGKTIGKPFDGSTNGSVKLLEFSPDGKKIGISTYLSLKQQDIWWDIESGQPDPLMNTLTVAWLRSPDGRYSVSVGCDSGNGSGCGVGLITLWDVQKRQPVGQPIRNPDSSVTVLGFSPDSRFLYTSEISKMTVWSLDPQDWLTRVCQIANRNFTQEEWSLYFDQAVYHATCQLAQ